MKRSAAGFPGVFLIIMILFGAGAAIAQDNAPLPTLPPTNTPRGTLPATASFTPTSTFTLTPSPTATFTATASPTATFTATATESPSPTETLEPALGGIPPAPTVFFPPDFTPAPQPTGIPTAMPRLRPRDPDGNPYDAINIVLIGHDSESLQVDNIFRTDTMIVVNINLTTNTVSMLSLPRDLMVMVGGWGMQRLNLAWGRGDAVGWTDGGWGLFRQTVLYNFGIELHYYALVDFTGFKTIIDTLGGVTVAGDCPLPHFLFLKKN